MNLETMRNTLRTKIGSPTVSDVSNDTLTRIINAVYREVGAKYPFNETRCIKAFDTIIGTNRYTLPTDLAVLFRVWDDTNKRKLTKRGVRYLATIPKNLADGAPKNYVRAKDWIQFIPTPDAVVSIQIYYLTEIADLIADEDEPVLPLAWHDGLILKARHAYYDERGDIGKAIYAKSEWKDWVSDKPSEIDQEKDDLEDAGVIVGMLGNEHGRRFGGRYHRTNYEFDHEL